MLKKLSLIALGAAVGLSSVGLSLHAADEAKAKTEAKSEAGWVSLFNGKDLTGWEGNTELWSVQDGTITGKTSKEKPIKSNTFLILKDQEVADFELTFQYKIVGGNSGVQYRSKVMDPKTWRVGGYQADFEAGKTYSGINYNEGNIAGKRGILAQRGTKVHYKADGTKEETKLEKTSEQLQAAIKNEDWNEYKIIAKGPHMIHMINGNVTSEVIDEDKAAIAKGILALQVHAGPPMTVQFKDIKIKKL
ncbi:3-keto-disaccharide hydrolase [Humisphaera borealis]|uniref:DUF1080 domain-containing protein n=1 Tax=Humisphaera borealis TaxID=2807512 RepID=A0A7M2WVU3_9BACT|nr:DUF1080 domain-containing protein [Humisphaera borealis]QOV88971.1 DUF1080 domain-containing protein [Humisphaera borealis]